MTQVERFVEGVEAAEPVELTTTYCYKGSGEMDSVTRPGEKTKVGDPLSPAPRSPMSWVSWTRMQTTIVDPAGAARKTVYAYDVDGNQTPPSPATAMTSQAARSSPRSIPANSA